MTDGESSEITDEELEHLVYRLRLRGVVLDDREVTEVRDLLKWTRATRGAGLIGRSLIWVLMSLGGLVILIDQVKELLRVAK